MRKNKIIGISLAGAMLFSSIAFAGEVGNNTEPIKPIPISAPITAAFDLGIAKDIQETDELVEINVQIPQIQGLKDLSFQEQLNKEISNNILGEIEEIKAQAREAAELAEKEGWEHRTHTLQIDFALKENGPILSFLVNSYSYTGGANGITRIDTYNINTITNQQLRLQDLFKPEADYQTIINEIILNQIGEQEKDQDKMYFTGEMGFETIGEEQDFYIEDDHLVILFQKYEIAPGAMGTPEFKIPMASLGDILLHGEEAKEQITYLSFTGTVQEIDQGDQRQILWLKDENGNPATFVITDDTYLVQGEKIAQGDQIIGFYDPRKPMLMIYPPRYNVEVVALVKDGQNFQVDSFDENLISSNGFLKLNISEDTVIITKDGTPYEGKLQGKILAVLYGASTKSIPAQTVPDKIVVLGNVQQEPGPDIFVDEATMAITVNGDELLDIKAYTDEDGTVMVPLRAVAEALGQKVVWHEENQSIAVDNAILKLGVDSYQVLEQEEKLPTAPVMKDYKVFVPVEFF